MSLAESIFNTKDVDEKVIEVPQWANLKIKVRGLSAAQLREVRRGSKDDRGNLDDVLFMANMVIAGVYDPATNNPVFSPVHRDQVLQKNPQALKFIAEEVSRISGFTEDALEEEVKNSLRTPNSTSFTS